LVVGLTLLLKRFWWSDIVADDMGTNDDST
jgi:hypothetical protein